MIGTLQHLDRCCITLGRGRVIPWISLPIDGMSGLQISFAFGLHVSTCARKTDYSLLTLNPRGVPSRWSRKGLTRVVSF